MPWSWSTPVGPTNGTREIDLIGATGLNLGPARRIPTTSDHDAVLVQHDLPAPATPQEPAVTRLPSTLPNTLRAAGLVVVEINGWQNNGRPASTGNFAPVGVLCHHTATGKNVSDKDTVNLLLRGRSDLPGPLCHFGLSRDGTVYVIASGRANHAGKAKASGTVAAGDGNSLYIGIEAFNDGRGEKWSAAQYDAYVKLAAALCRVTGNSAETVRGHKETSVTGKIDPTFPMDAFRKAVAAELAKGNTPAPTRPLPPAEKANHPGDYYRALEATRLKYEGRIDKGRFAARAWASTVKAAIAAGKRFA